MNRLSEFVLGSVTDFANLLPILLGFFAHQMHDDHFRKAAFL
jgi:hypothetical protein